MGSLNSTATAVSALISASGNLSAAANLSGYCPAAVFVPATWTAAVMTFQVSLDSGQTYADLYDANGEVSVAVVAGKVVRLNPADYAGFTDMKVRSGTAAVPVAQSSAATVVIGLRVI